MKKFLPGTIRQRIRLLMEYNHISQAQMAELLDMNSSTLSRFMTGSTDSFSPFRLVRLAEIFHVSTDFILGLTDVPNPKYTELRELGLTRKALQNLENHAYDPGLLSVILENPELARSIAQMLNSCPGRCAGREGFDD